MGIRVLVGQGQRSSDSYDSKEGFFKTAKRVLANLEQGNLKIEKDDQVVAQFLYFFLKHPTFFRDPSFHPENNFGVAYGLTALALPDDWKEKLPQVVNSIEELEELLLVSGKVDDSVPGKSFYSITVNDRLEFSFVNKALLGVIGDYYGGEIDFHAKDGNRIIIKLEHINFLREREGMEKFGEPDIGARSR